MNDELFKRKADVPMTKEEVRAISLSYLEIQEAKRLLDIGSGTGSVSLEALSINKNLQVIAIEHNPEAYQISKENYSLLKEKYALEGRIHFHLQKAPTSILKDTFDRVFIGGTKGNPEEIIKWAGELLEPDGIMVMNFITLENFYKSLEYIQGQKYFSKPSGCLCSVDKISEIGPYHYLKPNNPAFIIKTKKLKG